MEVPGSGIALSERSSQYTVQSGDTGEAIAQKVGVSFSALQAANEFVNWNDIWLGTVLTVPDSSGAGDNAAPAASTSTRIASGPCEGAAAACTGDITHYDGGKIVQSNIENPYILTLLGLGACGWTVNTGSDMQIALPHGLMGSQSNGNPYCGRSVTIQAPGGQPVQATVGDKCMGCEGDSIDLTNVLFSAVAPSGDGRVHGVSWYFN